MNILNGCITKLHTGLALIHLVTTNRISINPSCNYLLTIEWFPPLPSGDFLANVITVWRWVWADYWWSFGWYIQYDGQADFPFPGNSHLPITGMCMGFPAVKYKVFHGKPEITDLLTQGPRENSPSLHDTPLSQTGPSTKCHTTQQSHNGPGRK